ncbi:MAG: acdA 15 [Acidimicrobiales bacterium]|nr:acdA 15 [Acidimicrobiales bacterium]
MNLDLDDDQSLLQRTFRQLFARHATPERVRAAEPLGFDAALWATLAQSGVPGLALDGSLLDLALIAEAAGATVAPVPIVDALVATRLLGRDDGLVALAVRPGGDDGIARLVPAGAVARRVAGFDGGALVTVDREPPMAAPVNLGCSPLADVDLRDPSRSVVAEGDAARARYERAVDEWRVLTAAALVGLGATALELGVAYARSRRQFDAPIGSFQAVQQPLADVATALDGARLLVYEAACEETADLASMALAFAAETAQAAAGVSLHVHGGYGFMLEYDVQLFFRRAKAWPLALGDPARELDRLGDLRYGAVA